MHIVARLPERNGLHPDAGIDDPCVRQPARDARRTGIVGRSGQCRVAVKALLHLGEVGRAEANVAFGVGERGQPPVRDLDLFGRSASRSRHQLHETDSTGA